MKTSRLEFSDLSGVADLHAASKRTQRTWRSAYVEAKLFAESFLLMQTVGEPDFRPVEPAFIYPFDILKHFVSRLYASELAPNSGLPECASRL